MHIINNGSSPRKEGHGALIAATAIIIIGLLFLGRNLGFINHGVLRVVISWQMLLIFLGAVALTKRNNTGGAILIGVGLFFIVPRLTGAGMIWAATWWPLLLIIVGAILIVRFILPGSQSRQSWRGHNFSSDVSYKSDKGFVDSEVAFGSVNHIVVDPVFKGARIRNSFGATILDLRRTSLEAGRPILTLTAILAALRFMFHHPGRFICRLRISSVVLKTRDMLPGRVSQTAGGWF